MSNWDTCYREALEFATKVSPGTVLINLQDLCRDAPSRAKAYDFWLPNNIDGSINVLKNKAKDYTLQPTNEALRDLDGDDPAMDFFIITLKKTANVQRLGEEFGKSKPCAKLGNSKYGAKTGGIYTDELAETQAFALNPSESSSIDKERILPIKCVFVALGWLVEHEKEEQGTKKRTTNYVVLLNLSTQPTSVWLLYDYHMMEDIEGKVYWTNRLEDPYNPLFRQDSTESPSMSEIQDEFDVGNSPGTSAKTINFREFYTSQKLKPKKIPHKERREAKRNESHQTEDSKRGYFGLPQCFDLALLASDVEKWSPDGIAPTHVKKCLESSSVCYGESLQIKFLNKAELKTFKNNHKPFNMGTLGL